MRTFAPDTLDAVHSIMLSPCAAVRTINLTIFWSDELYHIDTRQRAFDEASALLSSLPSHVPLEHLTISLEFQIADELEFGMLGSEAHVASLGAFEKTLCTRLRRLKSVTVGRPHWAIHDGMTDDGAVHEWVVDNLPLLRSKGVAVTCGNLNTVGGWQFDHIT